MYMNICHFFVTGGRVSVLGSILLQLWWWPPSSLLVLFIMVTLHQQRDKFLVTHRHLKCPLALMKKWQIKTSPIASLTGVGLRIRSKIRVKLTFPLISRWGKEFNQMFVVQYLGCSRRYIIINNNFIPLLELDPWLTPPWLVQCLSCCARIMELCSEIYVFKH